MAATSALGRNDRPLQMFRLALVFLGTMMLIFDAIAFACNEYQDKMYRLIQPSFGGILDKEYYALYFLPDLFTMILYTLILVLVFRRNRAVGVPSTTVASASSTPFFSVWSILRILFTQFLSGLMLYMPFDEIQWTRDVVDELNKPGDKTKGLESYQEFNAWYLCGPRPTENLIIRGIELNTLWIYNGCMIERTRSFIAIFVGFLILVELTLTLKKAHAQKKNENFQKLELESEKA